MEKWRLIENPEKSGIWEILEQVLNNGGIFNKDKTEFSAPYVMSNVRILR